MIKVIENNRIVDGVKTDTSYELEKLQEETA